MCRQVFHYGILGDMLNRVRVIKSHYPYRDYISTCGFYRVPLIRMLNNFKEENYEKRDSYRT